MKTLSVRLPEALIAEIEAESRRRNVSKSDVVRERLSALPEDGEYAPPAIGDLIGSVDGLTSDLSARKKKRLKSTGYGDR
jgi:Arc/MetJ-type ribon-helix-helix transcriptional regulator